MNETKASWPSFFTWPLVGAVLAVSVLGMMTIRLFILPFTLFGLYAVLKWGGNRRSSVGLISGTGLPLFFVAYENR